MNKKGLKMENKIDKRVQCSKCSVWWEDKKAIICYICDKPINFKSKEISCVSSLYTSIKNQHLCSFKCLGEYTFENYNKFKLISLRKCVLCIKIFLIDKFYFKKLEALDIDKPILCEKCFTAGINDIYQNSQVYMESRIRELTKDREKAIQELEDATYRLTHPEDDE